MQIGTFEAAENHMKKARSVLAAVYNENLTRYDWHAPDPSEETCNQIVHVKLERQVGLLQAKIAQLEGQMAVAILDPHELVDLQETLMDVDDEISIHNGDFIGDNGVDGSTNGSVYGDGLINDEHLDSSRNFTTDNNSIGGDNLPNEESSEDGGIPDSVVSTTTENAAPVNQFDSVAGYMIFTLDVCIVPYEKKMRLTLNQNIPSTIFCRKDLIT